MSCFDKVSQLCRCLHNSGQSVPHSPCNAGQFLETIEYKNFTHTVAKIFIVPQLSIVFRPSSCSGHIFNISDQPSSVTAHRLQAVHLESPRRNSESRHVAVLFSIRSTTTPQSKFINGPTFWKGKEILFHICITPLRIFK